MWCVKWFNKNCVGRTKISGATIYRDEGDIYVKIQKGHAEYEKLPLSEANDIVKVANELARGNIFDVRKWQNEE